MIFDFCVTYSNNTNTNENSSTFGYDTPMKYTSFNSRNNQTKKRGLMYLKNVAAIGWAGPTNAAAGLLN